MQKLHHQVLIKRRYQICVHGSSFFFGNISWWLSCLFWGNWSYWTEGVASPLQLLLQKVFIRYQCQHSLAAYLHSGMQQGVDLNNLDCWPAPDSPSDRFLLMLMVKLILKQEIYYGAIWFPDAHCIIIRLLQRLVFLLIYRVFPILSTKKRITAPTKARFGFASTHQPELATNSSGPTIQLGALYDQAI